MNVSDFIQTVRDVASYDLSLLRSPSEEQASDVSIVTQANLLLAEWGERLGIIDTRVSLTLTTDEPVYAGNGPRFSRIIQAPKTVTIGTYYPIAVRGYEDFKLSYPLWRTTPSAIPYGAGWDGVNLYLWPPPNSTAAGFSVYVSAVCTPRSLSVDEPSAEIDLPLSLHSHLAYATVARMTKHSSLDQTQMSIIASFNKEAYDKLEEVALRLQSARRTSRRPVRPPWVLS